MRKLNFNLVVPFILKRILSPIPTSMKMKNHYYTLAALATLFLASCGALGKKDKGSSLPNDGQLHGIAPGSRYTLPKPPGMHLVHVTVPFPSADSGWMRLRSLTMSTVNL
jgi:hypothetical protein